MKTKTFFAILIGLAMIINTLQAQIYVIGFWEPSNFGSISFMIDYRGPDRTIEIFMDLQI